MVAVSRIWLCTDMDGGVKMICIKENWNLCLYFNPPFLYISTSIIQTFGENFRAKQNKKKSFRFQILEIQNKFPSHVSRFFSISFSLSQI